MRRAWMERAIEDLKAMESQFHDDMRDIRHIPGNHGQCFNRFAKARARIGTIRLRFEGYVRNWPGRKKAETAEAT